MENSFNNLGLDSALIDGLKKQNITNPTDIQLRTIPLALENRDIIGQSQTGSGKTLAYLLPIVQRINTEKKEMQSIILAPTHELALQIDKQIKLLRDNSGVEVTSTTIIGDVNVKRQIEKLKEKPHIIVGSPGRILELIKMKKITAHTIKFMVIDEGDKLLDQGNLNSVKSVIKTTLRDRQLMIFSATINEKTLDIAREMMKEPEIIKVEEKLDVNPKIEHIYITAEQRDKLEMLRKLLAALKPQKAIVFINKSEDIEIATLKLQYHNLKAYGLYGKVIKEERKKALDAFRAGKIQILVASDLAARGLHIEGVTHIFNMDLPEDQKEYLHRTGRTGRAGESGTAISIITQKELPYIRKLQRDFNITIAEKVIFKGLLEDPKSKGNRDSSKKSKSSANSSSEIKFKFRFKNK